MQDIHITVKGKSGSGKSKIAAIIAKALADHGSGSIEIRGDLDGIKYRNTQLEDIKIPEDTYIILEEKQAPRSWGKS